MRKLIFFLLPVLVLGQEYDMKESHHSRFEPGLGARFEFKERVTLESAAEWTKEGLRPSVEGGFLIKEFEFFGGLPFRTGVKIPVVHERLKIVAAVEQQGILGGISFIRDRFEILVLANDRVVKTAFFIRFKR